MKKSILLMLVLFLVGSSITFSQTEQVRKYLKLLASGKTEEVKKHVPDLLAEYPNHPGVLYLHAAVMDDAKKALDIYDKIIRNHGDSEWADDAYWRMIQYYAISGNIKVAEKELDAFRKKYPSSEFLAPASDVVNTAKKIMEKPKSAHSDKVAKADEKKADKKTDKTTKDKSASSEKKADKSKKSKASEKVSYGLQVGVFRTEETAKDELAKYKNNNIIAVIKPKDVSGEHMFAVVVGNYSDKNEAEKEKAELQKVCECSPIIVKK